MYNSCVDQDFFLIIIRCHQVAVKGCRYSVFVTDLMSLLVVCMWLFVTLENFSLIWRRHHCRWRAEYDQCSALMAIEQRVFFSVPHLLKHGASVYNGHCRGSVVVTVTSAPIAERLAVELSLPVFTTYVCRGWDSNTQPSACEANALNPLRHRRSLWRGRTVFEDTLFWFVRSHFTASMGVSLTN